MEQDVVFQRVGDEPFGAAVLSTVLHPVLLLGQLEELLQGDGFSGGDHQQACHTWMSRRQRPATRRTEGISQAVQGFEPKTGIRTSS